MRVRRGRSSKPSKSDKIFLLGPFPPSPRKLASLTSPSLSIWLVDPIVGCLLLKPAHPVSSFLGCVMVILLSQVFSNPGSNQRDASMPNIGRAYLARELFRCLELYKLEMRIMPVLMFVGRKEVCVDNHKLEEKANEMAGKVFILSSNKQVRTALSSVQFSKPYHTHNIRLDSKIEMSGFRNNPKCFFTDRGFCKFRETC